MAKEINGYMPVGMLQSLVVTIAYKPDYENTTSLADEMPSPETIVVSEMYVVDFINQSQFYLGLEEFVDFDKEPEEQCSAIAKFIEPKPGFCPYVVNAMFVDFMGKVQVIEDLDAQSNFPSSYSLK
ncbi:hypothetical protein AVV29_gp154 [Vibrio phage phi 3]|uniref:Uncharacterized protein n=1 Tax=Vibrio phage phi 3 TaxID=1589298 RepID=A0A0B5HAQ2_9CAUD|nr:hypothetical protein AVV29_gp154 [Vibrio phage phi 3]AJF40824.1 hypothetical protein SBVP3_0057 [Vibrio phage phi 3]